MAKEEKNSKTEQTEDKKTEGGSKISMKVFLFGIPIFIVQLVAVYFITANFLMKQNDSGTLNDLGSTNSRVENRKHGKITESSLRDVGKYIYSVNDIIVNPAGTDGKRLLLSSIAFDLGNEDDLTEVKDKDVIVKDLIISTLSSKSIEQLVDYNYKDSLRVQIANGLKKTFPDLKINNVYFSKYIIQ